MADWLAAHIETPIVSSALAKLEVLRACRRINSATVTEATTLVAGLDLIPISSTVIDQAHHVGDTTLRSLDAIHLASALSIRNEISTFVTYDHRLAEAASIAGLESLAPGA